MKNKTWNDLNLLSGQYPLVFFEDPDDAGASDDADDEGQKHKFEEWLEKQTEDFQAVYEDHIHGLKSALDKERKAAKEAAKLERRLEDLKDGTSAEKAKVKELEGELGSATAKAKKLEKALEETQVRFAVQAAAMQMGFKDPEDAYQLADVSELEISEETGEVEGVEEALEALVEAKPYLVGTAIGTPQRSNRGSGGDDETTVPPVKINF